MRERHSGEQAALSLSQHRVGFRGLLQCQIFGDADVAVECRVMLGDAIQIVASYFNTGELAAGKTLADIIDCHWVDRHWADCLRHYSITLGTR